MWSVHGRGCYSTSQRKAVLTQAPAWTDLEGVLLGEISQSHKDRCCMMPLR